MGQAMLKFADRRSLDEQFEAFHAAHPDVFYLFVRFAREAKASGRERFGAKAIVERLRWHMAISSSGEAPKINNNLTSRYARKAMDECPELAGFFSLRELRS